MRPPGRDTLGPAPWTFAKERLLERSTQFGKYLLLERINVGGMAEVFKAKTVGVEGFEKVVAIKRILPAVAEDRDFIGMFVDEAKITAALSHANLAQTFDLGRIDDTYYIAMEYVPGKDLRAIFERLKRRGERLPPRLAAYLIACVCAGLDYAHRKRDAEGAELHIVHRDVSPQNVIVSFEGEVKLIDFGIAKAANKITRTQAGILKGKFGYMSPEQVRGQPLDRRSDIFAAGVVLWELCTGERLFTGPSDFHVLEKVQEARVTPPSQIEPAVPARLERAILRALTREPADRYQQAGDLAEDLRLFLADFPVAMAPREELARLMRATFPDESARERAETRSAAHAGGPAATTSGGPAVAPSTPTAAAWRGLETVAAPTPPQPAPARSGAVAHDDAEPRRGGPARVATRVGLALGAALAIGALVVAAQARRAAHRAATSTAVPAPTAPPGETRAPAGGPPESAAPATLGFLSLGSRPPAKVIIDGVDTGRTTPLFSFPLKPGGHRVRLLAGGRARDLQVQIDAGRTVSEIVDLRGR
ncbi:MAG: hypothetical protein NVS4B10_13430 [Myxococcales bacterium]